MINKFVIKEIKSKKVMLQQFPLLKQLNPALKKTDYARMLSEMIKNGYRMVGAFCENDCVGTSGFWVNTKIWCGKYIEPDNIVVDKNYRSAGVGKILLDWISAEGKSLNCKAALLDSYVSNDKSHRFYFREGYIIKGFHFYKEL
jgi:GNAT superfamily N-acetyltransferase